MAKIIYTHTDEAPLLATYSFLPIIEAYARTAGVDVETRDISLAGRIIAQFPERLTDEQRIDDALAELGELATTPEANIIKLPNISASIPQLKAAIAELQGQGYDLPDYPESPQTDDEKAIRAKYDKVKGSAVNPVLREGNSDRRAPASVKNYAKQHPHSMGAWSADSKTNVATMGHDDFRTNEQLLGARGRRHPPHRARRRRRHGHRAQGVDPGAGRRGRRRHVHERQPRSTTSSAEQVQRAKDDGVLFSVHLKATMMKVSDPIIFGHVVKAFFPAVFEQYGDQLAAAGISPNDGLGAVLSAVDALPDGAAIRSAIEQGIADGPGARDGRLRQGHHQPARAVRRHRRRVDAGDDPLVRPHVERRRRGAGHPRGDPRLVVRRRSTRPCSTTAAPTARSTRPRWAPCPTSD